MPNLVASLRSHSRFLSLCLGGALFREFSAEIPPHLMVADEGGGIVPPVAFPGGVAGGAGGGGGEEGGVGVGGGGCINGSDSDGRHAAVVRFELAAEFLVGLESGLLGPAVGLRRGRRHDE